MEKYFQFQQNADIQIDSPHYRQDPTISDRIHCVLFVMKADLIREENNNFLKRVRSHIADKSKCNDYKYIQFYSYMLYGLLCF